MADALEVKSLNGKSIKGTRYVVCSAALVAWSELDHPTNAMAVRRSSRGQHWDIFTNALSGRCCHTVRPSCASKLISSNMYKPAPAIACTCVGMASTVTDRKRLDMMQYRGRVRRQEKGELLLAGNAVEASSRRRIFEKSEAIVGGGRTKGSLLPVAFTLLTSRSDLCENKLTDAADMMECVCVFGGCCQ